jgi:hypothetical protein
MEFSYQITEDDYVRGCKMALKSKRPALIKVMLFWVLVIIGLTLVFSIVQKTTHSSSPSTPQTESQVDPQTESEPTQVTQRASAMNVALNFAPLIAVLVIWGFLFFYWLPNATRRQYRKDTNSHGFVTVAIDAQSFTLQSAVGTSLRCGWNAFTEWREKDGIVLLRYPAGTFQFLNVAGLSEAERKELRGILTTALPQKK